MEQEIQSENYFYACDGTVMTSLEDLFEQLQEMPEHVFFHHVNNEKNDFHNWIKDVIGNHVLAKNLKNSKDADDMLRHVFVSLFR